MTPATSLRDRVIVVTGAGRGLGAAYARHLAALGAHVVVNDLGTSPAGEGSESSVAGAVVAEIRERGGSASADHSDIATEAGAESLVGTTVEQFGRLDGLVNNAGVLRSGRIVHLELQDWEDVLRVHLGGTFLTTRAAARWWRQRRDDGSAVQAAVVNTTSAAGLHGFVGEAAYSAAKAGIIGFTLTAAAELGRYGVQVNLIAPVARTRMTEWMGAAPDDGTDPLAPEHVAPVVSWLLCDPPTTGNIFEVGNGQVALVDGWKPIASRELTAETSEADVDGRLRALIAEGPPPQGALMPELPD